MTLTLFQVRLRICQRCPYLRKVMGALNCAKCGCFLAAKARMKSQHCPLGEW